MRLSSTFHPNNSGQSGLSVVSDGLGCQPPYEDSSAQRLAGWRHWFFGLSDDRDSRAATSWAQSRRGLGFSGGLRGLEQDVALEATLMYFDAFEYVEV
jgi:hypothetical protein